MSENMKLKIKSTFPGVTDYKSEYNDMKQKNIQLLINKPRSEIKLKCDKFI